MKHMGRAKDYSSILDDESALLQQAEQAENPDAFQPNKSGKHRPPNNTLILKVYVIPTGEGAEVEPQVEVGEGNKTCISK